MWLLDTSAWLEFLGRRGSDARLRQRVRTLLLTNQVASTGMVKLELLTGTLSQPEWDLVNEHIEGARWLEVVDEDWTQAARHGYELRRRGAAVPTTDLLIAAVAQRNGATVLHKDKHYDVLAAELGLAVESYVTSPSS